MSASTMLAGLASLTLGLPLIWSPAPDADAGPTEGALRVDAAVGEDEVIGHVAYLASDELGGRFTGSPGGALAADYLAERLADLVPHGLQPAGDDGTFLQDVHLTAVTFERLPTMAMDGRALVYGPDFQVRGGHGVSADLAVQVIDDEADLPAKPDPGVALYLSLNSRGARELIAAQDESWRAGWGALVERGFSRGRREVTDPARVRGVHERGEAPRLVVHGEAREAIEAGDVQRLTLDLGGSVKQAHNVVALLPGAGRDRLTMGPVVGDAPVNPAIVISAHYDHLRQGTVPEGAGEDVDVIYNGADDDASGVAVVLEVIEALCLAEERPDRDVVVLLATGEEIGLVGTTYYLDHPTVPLEHTVANLNFEMLGRPDALVGGPGKVWLTGFEHTNLGLDYQAAGLDVLRDPRPTQHFFERSDNYAFVLKGVVGQSFSTYDLHQDYHRVTDEVETLDGAHLAAATRVCLEAVRMTLSPDQDVSWVEGFKLPIR